MHTFWKRSTLLLCTLSFLPLSLNSQANLVSIDASSADAPESPVVARLGSSRNPAGHTIGATSQNLTFDGKPWIPVMGELHYSRLPESEWEPDILRMKSAGINVIASYVIWIHHEQDKGYFTWTGNKDLRHFAELCAKHGMLLYPRIGPWAHAEVRNGGLPDWVAAMPHTRENDPQYLSAANVFYQQIGAQMKGLYWKDGGPIIGLQIENEYRATGAGKGSDHIRTLKSMALAAGIDVPLYTVTGWDGAAIPLDAALPVFGGYPDAPWDGSPNALPPPEIYTFRFDNRSAGNMGAIGGNGQGPASAYQGTPFLTAELGGGIQDTYFRRPVVSADDIAAIPAVMLGSGANMLGYYMFAGGRNPDGGAITLQESQRTGYPTDVPVKSYDFQAPISNNGEERESLRRLKLVHYFLNDFGEQLAPMRVHRPTTIPSSAEDLSVPRVSARTHGDSGFIFFNNHTRGAAMPARTGFQVQLKLPGGTLRVPQEPITLPSETYGIWPVNLDLNGVKLRYSTAQLMNRLEHNGETFVFFFTQPGVVPEFLLDTSAASITAHGFKITSTTNGSQLRAHSDSGDILIRSAKGTLRLVLLTQTDALNLWKVNDGKALLITKADVFSNSTETTLQQDDNPQFQFSLFHASTTAAKHAPEQTPQFATYQISVPPVPLKAMTQSTAAAGVRSPLQNGPAVAWRKSPIPMAPDDQDFAKAARWTVTVRGNVNAPQLADVLLRIRYQGDVGRLKQDGHLRDDDFWNGTAWKVGLHNAGVNPASPFELEVLPLPQTFPMFLEARSQLEAGATSGTGATLQSVEAVPRYSFKFRSQPN